MKKRLRAAIAAIILLIGMIGICARYYLFVSQTIRAESISHLTEIFHQANSSLTDFVQKNWGGLRLWADYLRDVSDEADIEAFLAHAKEKTGFTDFYFVSGRAVTGPLMGRPDIWISKMICRS